MSEIRYLTCDHDDHHDDDDHDHVDDHVVVVDDGDGLSHSSDHDHQLHDQHREGRKVIIRRRKTLLQWCEV